MKVCLRAFCGQRKRRSACASAQSDLGLRYPLIKTVAPPEYIVILRTLIRLFGFAGRLNIVRICLKGPISNGAADVWTKQWSMFRQHSLAAYIIILFFVGIARARLLLSIGGKFKLIFSVVSRYHSFCFCFVLHCSVFCCAINIRDNTLYKTFSKTLII